MSTVSERIETNCDIKNTLIVEDDQAIRDTLKLVLELEGYTVFTAANGKEGIETLHRISRPCIIFLDLMMPVMNGWEFIEVLEKDIVLATIPVVVVSAYADKAKTIRAKGIIKKPVDIDILLKFVQTYCNKG